MRLDVEQYVQMSLMNNLKPNFAEVGRRFGVDPRTVKRYYDRGQQPQDKHPQPIRRPSKLDGFRAIIEEKVNDGCSATAIYYFIKERGYQGKPSILRDYCRQIKTTATKKATIRIETSPGLSAQVDWKEDITLVSRHGEVVRGSIFLYVLGYSRMKYMAFVYDRTQTTFFDCLTNAFWATGGVPQEIWFDNQKVVVDRHKSNFGKPVFNATFAEYAKDAGFKPIACRPFRPQTKGKVEALARTTQRLQVYNHEFEEPLDLAELVHLVCDQLNHEESQATHIPPYLLLDKEKEYLHDFDYDLLDAYANQTIARKVSRESMVVYQNRKYSVPIKYIDETVQLKSDEQTLHIYYNGELIRSHALSTNRFNYTRDDMTEIVRSDLYQNRDEAVIDEFVDRNLKMFDEME